MADRKDEDEKGKYEQPRQDTSDSDEAATPEPPVERTDNVGHAHASVSDHIRETMPWRIHIWVAQYPLLCCIFMFLWFIVCGIIIASVPGMLAFSTDVPFYIRDSASRTYQDALVAGKDDATWARSDDTQSAAKPQQDESGITLNLLYKVKDGNTLMKSEYLSIMDEIEDRIKAIKEYDSYCLRLYGDDDMNGTCSRQLSLTSFFDVDYFKPSIHQNYTLDPSFIPNFAYYLVPSLIIDGSKALENKNYEQEFIDSIASYWAAYDQGEGPPEDYAQKYYQGEKMPPKFYYKTTSTGAEYSVSNVFASLSDRYFAYDTPLDTDVVVALSIFSFGLPLEGYNNSVQEVSEQQDEIGQFCYNELHEIFVDFAAKYEDKLEFYWNCGSMLSYYTQDVLASDMRFMIATFLSVFVLMVNGTGSVWLGSCGLLMIFMNFLPSMLLYRYIANLEYFGTLQMMAMFIILSIGADNIFVINDTYAQYRTAAPNESMDKRLTATLRHAGKVMATTSLSTCFSFIANTTSVFPAVYTFGTFAALLVFVNYCAVVLFYPTVLAVHERYFLIPNLKRSCCIIPRCASGGKCNKCCCFNNVIETQEEEDGIEQEQMRGIDAFFEFKFYSFIKKHRRRILALTLVIFLIFFYCATQIDADPEAPQLYADGNNYQEYRGVLTDNFASETGTQLEINIVWGIDGLDREGTDATLVDDIGTVIYSSNVSYISPNEQKYLAQFCDDLLCLFGDYSCRYSPNTYYDLQISDPANYGDAETSVVKCFMKEFREWVLTDATAVPDDSDIADALSAHYGSGDATSDFALSYNVSDFAQCEYGVFPIEDRLCFMMVFHLLWMNDLMPTSNPDYSAGKINYDYWKSSIYGKMIEGSDSDTNTGQVKFFIVSVLTEASLETNPDEGVQLWDDWQTFGDNWKNNIDGQNDIDKNGEQFVETPQTLQSMMITDKFLFAYYFVQKQITTEAISGIALSLLLAFIILSLATGNWLIAMYSCCVIFVLVMCVIGFTVMSGWKLGLIEAIIYVMVVGMSVDYVVHLSEAYLASGKNSREERAQRMLGIVGGSVVSGAVSTLLGIVWLFGATNYVFYKFGAFIFFLISMSLIMSMVFFTAAMSQFGPEGSSGNVMLIIKRCYRCLIRQESGNRTADV